MLRNRNAQAVLELAVLGSLIITFFALIISKSEHYNRQQSYMQQTFRAALTKAHEINNSVSWSTVDFRRMPNATDPVEIGDLEAFSSGNSVLWSDGKKKDATTETEPESWFELNRRTRKKIPVKDPVYQGTETSSFGYTSNVHHTGTVFHKDEAGNNIHTTKQIDAYDDITGGQTVNGTPVIFDSHLENGGVYSPPGGGLHRGTDLK